MGGASCDSGIKNLNDVWYSDDCINWTRATDSAAWSKRILHSSVVFDNKMWILGGNGEEGIKGDVWNSTDGVNWTCVTESAPWARYAHTSLVFNDKMWILGGSAGLTYKNDAWYSTDGKTWNKIADTALWQERLMHTSVVFDNKIWIIGGENDTALRLNDAWYSQGLTAIDPKSLQRPLDIALLTQISPNPFRSSIRINFQIYKPSTVTIRIFNSTGRQINLIRNGTQTEGSHTLSWNGCDNSGNSIRSGVYYLRLETPGSQATHKMIKSD